MKFYLTIAILFCCITQPVYSKNINSLLSDKDALLVINDNNTVVFSKNPEKQLIPASTLKILTSLSAFHYLGEDFRFKTEFYLSSNNDLIIKGYGDPLLISEIIVKISKKLSNCNFLKNIQINNIILDNSFFTSEIVPGSTAHSAEPYDAQTGALCVNFNTVNFISDSTGTFLSAESQTPLIPFVMSRIKETHLKSGRIILTGKEKSLYPGYLFRYFLKKNGITIAGKITIQRAGSIKKKLIFTYYSEFNLTDLVSKLLAFSNNFIANQIFLAFGAKKFGEPANLSKSIRATKIYTDNLNESLNNKIKYHIIEGSGLSRENSISAKSMATLLLLFEKKHNLMRNNKFDFYKTGTLTDISTRAGFLMIDDKNKYRYVIMCNTPGHYSKSILDMVIRRLQN